MDVTRVRGMRLAFAVLGACLLSVSLSAQWLPFLRQDVPRTADGKPDLSAPPPRLANGKPDLSSRRPACPTTDGWTCPAARSPAARSCRNDSGALPTAVSKSTTPLPTRRRTLTR